MEKFDIQTARTWAEIDLGALRSNYAAAKAIADQYGAALLAVIKADAYGHGAVRAALELEKKCGASAFAVATLPEAFQLTGAGVRADILILSEVHDSLYGELAAHSASQKTTILPSIFRFESAKALSDAACRKNVKLGYFIALDTGMSRIGFECLTEAKKRESLAVIERIHTLPGIECRGIFSHFARADETDKTSAFEQLDRFDDFIAALHERGIRPPVRSICNSAALIDPAFTNKYDLVREGVILYGLAPSDETPVLPGLRPVMSVKARVTDVKTLGAGVGISYGHTFVTERPTRVATIPVGYADGYPRLLSGKGCVLIGDYAAPILGRVCMDQMMVDVTGIPDVSIGTVVTVLGADERVRADRLAAMIGTIGYELICAVSPRVPRVYLN